VAKKIQVRVSKQAIQRAKAERLVGDEVEPFFLTENLDLIRLLNWFSYRQDNRSAFKHFLTYMEKFSGHENTNLVKSLDPNLIPLTAMGLAYFHNRGFTLFDHNYEYLATKICDAINRAKKIKADDHAKSRLVSKFVPSDSTNEFIGTLEHEYDKFTKSFKSQFSALKFLEECKPKQSDIDKATEYYLRVLNELHDPEIEFLYSKPELKKVIGWVQGYLDALQASREEVAVRKPRAPKPVKIIPPEKQVENMKFMASDPESGMVSIHPKNIVGAKQLWCYMPKWRGLYVYNAPDDGSFTVKGSKVIGYDPQMSQCKKLRKPDEILPVVMEANKVSLRKLMPTIKTMGKPGNGRITEDMIILKVVK